MSEAIPEQNFKAEDIELGGNLLQWLDIENIKSPVFYYVKNYSIDRVTSKDKKIDYGQRVVLELCDTDGNEVKISDWNFAMKAKIKLPDMIEKKIKLSPLSAKRLKLEVE